MKRKVWLIIGLIIVIYAGICIKTDSLMRKAVLSRGLDVEFKFAAITGPYTVTLFGVESGNLNAFSVSLDLNFLSYIFSRQDRAIDGVSINGMELIFADPDSEEGKERMAAPFVLPFMKSLSVSNGSIIYYNSKTGNDFKITGITMRSRYNAKAKESERVVAVNGYGYLMGKKAEKLYLKLDLYPYFKNRFLFSVFGGNINLNVFEPVFADDNIRIESGKLNFVAQIKGENRKLYINNIMQFKNVKVSEKNAGLREFLGLSYGDIVRFNTDTKGDFDLAFDFSMPDSEFTSVFWRFGSSFKETVKSKVMMGVLTAPFRKAGETLWDMTGGNVKRLFDMITGTDAKKQEEAK